MPKLTIEGFTTVDVPDGKRLVLAIEQDAGVDVLHAAELWRSGQDLR